ncbi:hypothetical protein OHB13_11985 [Streptomyces sp. NBC_00440]|uniref:hypothetical protein n=1 Tax=Streptomyces sp. NBC_00440 TaxID=2975741 RepID=UPI002E1F3682
MTEWHNRIGYPQLGREGTPDYRGYVVRVQGTVGGHPEKWFTYAFDQGDQHTYWIGVTDSEPEAKGVLERLIKFGWVCEVYVSVGMGHCAGEAAMVRHTYREGEPKGLRVRVLLCERHGHVFSDWERMTIPEYIRTYNGLEQDAALIGARK